MCNFKVNGWLLMVDILTVLVELAFSWSHKASLAHTVYPKKYAHGFVVLCFVVVMQSFIMNSHKVFIHIHQGCFAGTGAIVRLPQCQWSKPDGYGKISQCITTTKHSKAKTVCIFLGIYCTCPGYSLEPSCGTQICWSNGDPIQWHMNGFMDRNMLVEMRFEYE